MREGLNREWWVLAGLFCVYAASNGILMHTLPLTYPSLIDEFGWDQVQVTLPATVLFVVAAFVSPPIGIMLDRYSPRKIIATGSVGMVLGLFAFSRITELWHLVTVYVLFALALSACGIVPTMLVLTRWFNRLRGRATGILLLASSLGAAVFPLVLGAAMEAVGWRGALMVFAAIAMCLSILPALLLIKDRPAESPAANAAEVSTAAHTSTSHRGPTFSEAIRQPRFYLIAFATGSIWLTVISLLQHQSIYLAKDIGIAGTQLPAIFSTFFSFSVVGKFSFGWLSDRLDKGITLMVSIGILGSSIFLLKLVSAENVRLAFVYAAIAGIGFSGAFTAIQIWIASFYSGLSYGKILATITLFDTLSGALGTRVAGQMRTGLGSYLPVFDLLIGLCMIAIFAILIVKRMHARDKVTVMAEQSA